MSVYLKPEPPIEISLDGKWIGTIERAKMSQDLFSAMAEGPPKTEEVRFEIQAGHHDLTLDVSWFQGLLISYTIFGVAPAIQSFDIAPGETVTFLCQYNPMDRGFGYRVLLKKQ